MKEKYSFYIFEPSFLIIFDYNLNVKRKERT